MYMYSLYAMHGQSSCHVMSWHSFNCMSWMSPCLFPCAPRPNFLQHVQFLKYLVPFLHFCHVKKQKVPWSWLSLPFEQTLIAVPCPNKASLAIVYHWFRDFAWPEYLSAAFLWLLEFLIKRKRKRERNVEIFISHKSLFSSHSQVFLALASG
jgi:hypothetical protein